ncbi:MAG: PHP domain-containing protein [Leptolyngbya sp. DLM2.Bin15]|nr:MAG: PHP domain-containing protein [Leptolyngbya sp. DLM2.Bin15]
MAVNVVYESTDHRAAQDIDALRQIFEHFTSTSCPQNYNFHLHTTCSDGRLAPTQVIDQAIALGLKGLAITDHHSVRGYYQAQAYLAQVAPAASQLRLWTGMEISAGLLDNEVHILCYGFDPSHTALHPYQQQRAPRGIDYEATQVINAVHQAGGLAVLAHPDRYRRSPQDLIDTAATLGIDGVEVFYAYNNPSPWTPSPRQTQLIQDLANQYGLLKTGGTDTHGLSLLQRI